MAPPTIGLYTEKKILQKITNLKKRIQELETFISQPPFIIFNGIQDIPSDFSDDWKNHVNYILNLNKINPNWILDLTNPTIIHNKTCNVTIQFVSHCVKNHVYKILTNYIKVNQFDEVSLTLDGV
jgi:hypothetical protein